MLQFTKEQIEKIEELVLNFDDFEYCQCDDCKADSHSHAVDVRESKKNLVRFLKEELEK